MSEGEMFIIEVPASSANLGPGFDSIGIALNLYLRLEVRTAEQWEVILLSESLNGLPNNEDNFIVQIAEQTAKKYGKELPACKLSVSSDIPLARGLGSSASAIVAGIELADAVCGLNLSKWEKFELASREEGHPDNAGASVFGGLVIGAQSEDRISAAVFPDVKMDIVAAVPKNELLTKKSRSVLPEVLSYKDAVQAGAVGNVLVAALLSGNFELAGEMMRADRFHHPYRKELVPELEVLEREAPKHGAFGVALSGAGPTVLCFAKAGQAPEMIKHLKRKLSELDFHHLSIDQTGSSVYRENVNISAS